VEKFFVGTAGELKVIRKPIFKKIDNKLKKFIYFKNI
jgi:hypothetical protein